MRLVTEENIDRIEETPQKNDQVNDDSVKPNKASEPMPPPEPEQTATEPPENKGELIVDAAACPQDISYPTDLNLLNDARSQSEKLIDILYNELKLADDQTIKPRTYRQIARKEYLKVAQKKHKTKKEIRHALRKQLSYLNRNINNIHQLLKHLKNIPLQKRSTSICW
jgi:hypothetical protein